MIESAITSKGQTTLPKAVREALAVQPGDRVRYIVHGDEVRIRKVKPIGRLFGASEVRWSSGEPCKTWSGRL